MVSWRIAALLAVALVGSSWLSAQSPLQRGQELRYEGEVKVEIPEKSLVVGFAKVQMLDLVTAAGEGQKLQIASLRLFQFQVQERPAMEAALRFLSIAPTGEEEPAPLEQLLAETPPIGFSGQFPVVLPFYFLPQEQLKEGNAWARKERALLAPEPTGEFRYQVVGKEKIGDKECWVVTRTLQKPIVLNPDQGTQLAKVTDRFGLEIATGLVVQAQRQMTLQVQKEQSVVLTLSLNLRGTQKLDDAAFQQRTQQLEAVRSIHKKVGASVLAQPTKESLDEAEKAVTEFLKRYKDSPYAPHVETWQRLIAFVRQQRGQLEQQRSLLGQEAPDFNLPTVDGRRKVKLSDQRGKVVVLNFFAHWCGPCGAEAPRLEQIWREYRDKGVVVIGVAIFAEGDPFKEAQGFTQKHKLTYLVLVDAQNQTPDLYDVEGVPTNVVIGRDGKIRYLRAGFSESELRKAIEEALKQ